MLQGFATANVGSLDRVARLAIGTLLLAAPFLMAAEFAPLGAWRFAVAGVGAVLLATAFLRFCPAYRLIGVRTCATVER